jgi:nicotinamide/nicotinate riboside kinase
MIRIGFGGASCSGKSTVSSIISQLLSAHIIHQDKFYKTVVPMEDGIENWDCPESIDTEAFKQYIENETKSTLGPNRSTGSILVNERIQSLVDSISSHHRPIILIDGFLIYHEEPLLGLFDIKFFLSASYDCLKHRRMQRTHYITDNGDWIDPPGYFDSIVYPSYLKYNKLVFENTANFIMVDSEQNSIQQMVTKCLEGISEYLYLTA